MTAAQEKPAVSHTPGPWDCWDMDEFGWHVFATKWNLDGMRKQDCRLSVAQVRSGRSHTDSRDNYDEGVANARLIAAAPAMLAALKASEREYEDLEDRAPADSGCIECTAGTVPNHLNTGLCAHHLRRAAIALAEQGRTS